jgi:hypothetical protein
LIEATLYALAALAKENIFVASHLEKPLQDGMSFDIRNSSHFAQFSVGPPPLVTVLKYTKSRSLDVQLAACLWYVLFKLICVYLGLQVPASLMLSVRLPPSSRLIHHPIRI